VSVGELYVGDAFEWVGWKEVGVVMACVPEYEEMLCVVMLGCESRTLSPVVHNNIQIP
jgi:hypothetical protein